MTVKQLDHELEELYRTEVELYIRAYREHGEKIDIDEIREYIETARKDMEGFGFNEYEMDVYETKIRDMMIEGYVGQFEEGGKDDRDLLDRIFDDMLGVDEGMDYEGLFELIDEQRGALLGLYGMDEEYIERFSDWEWGEEFNENAERFSDPNDWEMDDQPDGRDEEDEIDDIVGMLLAEAGEPDEDELYEDEFFEDDVWYLW
jgi:hypothetical protein